ncbi:MAG: hypothetical protein LCH77_17940 [Actinobacteria bacterium]|uniref:Uncharacterized protein n=1 Tax=Nostocoides veronense TaxID=330836 RepID=A0ABN2M847_9MICO|nr:hypothetical protein [Actinomycetota bacterium]
MSRPGATSRSNCWRSLLVALIAVLATLVGAGTACAIEPTATYDVTVSAYDHPREHVQPDTRAPSQRGTSAARLGSTSPVALSAWLPRGVAANTVDDILPTPRVGSTKLQNLVNNLYKGTTNPNRVGYGTTMDAIRNEIATGVPTSGRMHTIKGQETLRGLNNWLRRNPDAAYSDRLVAQSLADELSIVLRGGTP